jgi:hypothetical protein
VRRPSCFSYGCIAGLDNQGASIMLILHPLMAMKLLEFLMSSRSQPVNYRVGLFVRVPD